MNYSREGGIQSGTRNLIVEGHVHDAFYDGNLSNHLPMALVALDRLGAAPEQIAAFAARYRRKLQPLAAPAAVITEATTRHWTSRLIPGVGSMAFHGLIRMAYALDGGVEAELIHALAHWAAAYAVLGALPSPGRGTGVARDGVGRVEGSRAQVPRPSNRRSDGLGRGRSRRVRAYRRCRD